MTPIMVSFSRAKNVAEIRVKPGNEFHRNIEEIQAGADHLRFNQTGGMEMDQQRNVLGTADKEFHHREIMRLQRMGRGAAGNGNEPLSPTCRQGFQNGIPQNIRMVSVTQVVGAVFAQGLIEHGPREFVEGIRAQIGIVGGGKRGIPISKFGKGREQRS